MSTLGVARRRTEWEPSDWELTRACLDPGYFIDRFCKIRPATGGAPIPFRLWDAQREVVQEIDESAMTIFLKARQLGLSWATLGYGLWHTNCGRGHTMLVLNRNATAAAELLERVKFMHRQLPRDLRARVGRENRTEIEFPELDSRILSLPTTEFSGSGLTATFVMLDEWAKLSWTEQLWASIEPTISAGGKLAGISTAQGRHNQFARMWRAAVDGESSLVPIFLPWWAHPARDDAWYAERRRNWLAASGRGRSDRLFKREFPETPNDAFATTGLEVFGDEWDRQRHVYSGERRPAAHQWPVWRGIDFGYHHSPVVWAEIQQERVVIVFAELPAEKLTTDELGDQVLEMDEELGIEDSGVPWCGVDPAGKAASNQGDSDVVRLEAKGLRVTWEQVDPADRVDQIKQLLRQGRLRIHASCVRLIEAIETAQWARVREADDVLKETYAKDGLLDHYCLVPGTLVSTQRGPVPIEQITALDRVLTRRGYRPVMRAWRTSPCAPVVQVTMSDGGTLTGTGGHPVWVDDRGWARLDTLGYGDILTTWEGLSHGPSAGWYSAGTRMRNRLQPGATSRRAAAMVRQASSVFTTRSGRQRMGQSLRAVTSTTAMLTRAKTPSRTSSAWRTAITCDSTRPSMPSGVEITWRRFGRWPQRGTALTRAAHGTPRTGVEPVRRESRARSHAGSAGSSTSRSRVGETRGTARGAARRRRDEPVAPTTRLEPASGAVEDFASTDTGLRDAARVSVVSVCAAGFSPVYNLEVGGEHEFFANGVLTHNCDALGYLLICVWPPEPRGEAAAAETHGLAEQLATGDASEF